MKTNILVAVFSLLSNEALGVASGFERDCFIKPCEIKGDFDGDKKTDTATLVKDKSGRKGIEIKFANGKNEVIGAGHEFGRGGDDLSWMDVWNKKSGKIGQGASEEKPPKARGEYLLLVATGSASAIAYYDGQKFKWYQQGD